MFSVGIIALNGTKFMNPNQKPQEINDWTQKCTRLIKAKIDTLTPGLSDKEAEISQNQLSNALDFLEKIDADKKLKKINCDESTIKNLADSLMLSPNKEVMEPLAKTLNACLHYV